MAHNHFLPQDFSYAENAGNILGIQEQIQSRLNKRRTKKTQAPIHTRASAHSYTKPQKTRHEKAMGKS